MLLQEETLTTLTLSMLDSSRITKLFFLEVQLGSYVVDPALLLGETKTKLTLYKYLILFVLQESF